MAEQKVVIVTGGTYGIGRGITIELAERGYHVVAFGLEGRQMGSVAENGIQGTRAELDSLGLTADLLEADVSNRQDVEQVVDLTAGKFGRIDGLVNNAAIHPAGTILDTSEEMWDRVLAVNLKGPFLCTKAVLPFMLKQGGGAIVNLASKASWGQPNLLAYSASKGGILALSFALGYDHLLDHIRVNTVVPSGVVTGMTEGSPHLLAAAQNSVAGRNVLPGDIASAVGFLLSEEADQITGAVLNVGGFAGQGGPARARATAEQRA
jgi:NAD(P)-dependent dehydrogenase (short-subunit alcohol dehydrogenase family)